MDQHTLELLEFAKVCELVAEHAGSRLGKERAAALTPLTDRDAIQEALDRTTEMVEAIETRLTPPLGGLRDVRLAVKRAGLGVLLEMEPLLEIRDVLELTGRVFDYRLRLGTDFPRLVALLAPVPDLRPLAHAIDTAIDERGQVRSSASPELARVRGELAVYEEKIQVELRRLLRSPEIRSALRFASPTLSGEHHVLPVAVNHRHKVAGVVHRTSSTGETVYIEPAKVAELTAEIAVLKNAEQREIRKVLRRLTALIGQESERLLRCLEILAELDLVHAKATYSRQYSMAAPTLTTDGRLRLVNARHPLLEALFRRRAPAPAPTAGPESSAEASVVPVSVHLGEDFDLLVITGPNTGGKTVTLKTVGLVCTMALAGMHIPAGRESRVPLLRDVLADIGDEQSLEQSLSTFSAHISRIAEILRQGGADTLVLLDELGAGTDPSEGAALGRAILDELVRLQCRAIVTTHLGDLKTYAFSCPRAENAAVEFDVATLRPTYRLLIGQFGESCALRIARRLKLPRHLLRRAERYLHRRRGLKGSGLGDLQRLREEAEKAREQAVHARTEADQAADDYRRRAELLQQEASIKAEIEKARSTLRAGDVVRVTKFDRTGTVVRVDQRRRRAAVNVGAVEWELGLDELLPALPGAAERKVGG